MNWTKSCAYDAAQKHLFHSNAHSRLRRLAKELGLAPGSYDLRSNQGGIAVSGEVTLHHEQVYVQVSQSALGGDLGVLIRTCRGRRDYVGGPNNFASLGRLDDVPALAACVRAVMNGRYS
jgi:hypothetical protein